MFSLLVSQQTVKSELAGLTLTQEASQKEEDRVQKWCGDGLALWW
jgi:hypothetical protein